MKTSEVNIYKPLNSSDFGLFTMMFIGLYILFSLFGSVGGWTSAYQWIMIFVATIVILLLAWFSRVGMPRYLYGVVMLLGWSCPLTISFIIDIIDDLGLDWPIIIAPILVLVFILVYPAFSDKFVKRLDIVFDPNRRENPALLRLLGVAGVLGAIIGLNARKWFGDIFAAVMSALIAWLISNGLIILSSYGFWKYHRPIRTEENE